MRSTKDLRKMLFEQLDGLNNKTKTVKEVSTFAKVASQIVYSARLDIENKRIEVELMKTTKRPKKNIDGKNISIPSLEL